MKRISLFYILPLLLCTQLNMSCSKDIKPAQDFKTCENETPGKKNDDPCLQYVVFDGLSIVKVETVLQCQVKPAEETFGCSERGSTPDDKNPIPPDACGCDGKECQKGLSCHREVFDLGAGCGGPLYNNQCFASCNGHADCAEDELCFPGGLGARSFPRCIKVACKTDADCTERPCGKCIVAYHAYQSQCLSREIRGTTCYYQGDQERNAGGAQGQPGF